MGRMKVQIKRIENTTNRQVTFSKRRTGLIKKAYELSVLCDVDLALIMFSPSGRVSFFSGNKSIEEVLARYVNLPDHEQGRTLHNQQLLKRILGKLWGEAYQNHQPTSIRQRRSTTTESHLKEIQQKVINYKSQTQDLEKYLRIAEGDPSEITTLGEIELREQILEETLKQVRLRKKRLEEECNSPSTTPTSQAHLPPETAAMDGQNGTFVTESTGNIMDEWLPQEDSQVNFVDSNGLLPLRDEADQGVVETLAPPADQGVVETLAPPSDVFQGQNINIDQQISSEAALEDNNDMQHLEFGQATAVNLSPWTEFYPTGNELFPDSQPSIEDLIESYLSQFSPLSSST